jgi:hypothetical protein
MAVIIFKIDSGPIINLKHKNKIPLWIFRQMMNRELFESILFFSSRELKILLAFSLF